MLKIPYVPNAYPDEILASLLTRLMLHNGSGLWRSLLEDSGYGRRTISPFFSPPIQDAKLERLLTALGYTYPRTLRDLTVLPFWLSFNRATRAKAQIKFDATSGRITKLTTLGHSQSMAGARYCPACLRDDFTTHGEPYIHRHHQLPVVGICARHGVALRISCPACGITAIPFNRALLRPPSLRCRCGQDLSRITSAPPAHQQALLRLSRFAADTLSCTDAPWTLGQVLTVLYERSDIVPKKSFKRGALQLMRDAYGPPGKRGSRATTILSWGAAGSSLRLNVCAGVTMLRAPEFCALLAGAGLTFDEFRLAVNQVDAEVATAAAPTKYMRRRDFTIDQARKEFKRFEAESPGQADNRLRRSSQRLYWMLRFHDRALMQAFGYPNRNPDPTIEADRKKVDELLRHGGRIPRDSCAGIRASIRDHVWLQSRIRAQRAGPATPNTPAQRVQRDRAEALSQAVLSVLRTEARPARVHAGLLAKFVQISMHQAQYTIARTPALQTLIAEVNGGKDRRMALWAARTLIEEGRHPSAKEVLVRAGLNTTRLNRQLCVDAIASLAADQSVCASSPDTS